MCIVIAIFLEITAFVKGTALKRSNCCVWCNTLFQAYFNHIVSHHETIAISKHQVDVAIYVKRFMMRTRPYLNRIIEVHHQIDSIDQF